jgi:hypothetical protein
VLIVAKPSFLMLSFSFGFLPSVAEVFHITALRLRGVPSRPLRCPEAGDAFRFADGVMNLTSSVSKSAGDDPKSREELEKHVVEVQSRIVALSFAFIQLLQSACSSCLISRACRLSCAFVAILTSLFSQFFTQSNET